MVKMFNPVFTINVASKVKVKRESSSSSTKLGKFCLAVVFKDEDKLKARLITSPVEDNDWFTEFHVIDFTEESFNLRGKTHVFLKERDKYGHRVCVIRNGYKKVYLSPGLDTQYDTLYEGLLVKGHIIKKNGKHYFNYEQLVAYTEYGVHIDGTDKLEMLE